MLKHGGFPGRLPGSDLQFAVRRANPRGVTAIVRRERYRDRKSVDRKADVAFVKAIWDIFGADPFERGNLDAGRLSWVFGREVLPYDDPFDPQSYDARLVLNEPVARASFPDSFVDDFDDLPPYDPDEEDWD